ncbi:MAG TPA: hypothetical protein DCE42_19475 [Myxococcales bacterium]|nr:hypothetical protein [Deltaproteobacteria bacterium]MBU51472.1 hypothetical protein [Deltaproteobacteria bacterium]HAA56956.1 hypothetical protein [Myxococcales bacterium]
MKTTMMKRMLLGLFAMLMVSLTVACGDLPGNGQCFSDADCGAGLACQAGACVSTSTGGTPCESSDDCGENQRCNAETKTCRTRRQRTRTSCQSDSDCYAHQTCDATENVCKRMTCTSNDDCGNSAECNTERGFCFQPCAADADCEEGLTCNTERGACTARTRDGSRRRG